MNEEQNDIVVIEQKAVVFYNDELVAVKAQNGRVFVSFRHLCDALDIDRTGQLRRVQRHAVLAKGYAMGNIISPTGGTQRAGLLRIDLIPLWLAGMNISRVAPELQERLERYQEEAAAVLWEAFQNGRLTSDTNFNALLENDDSPAVQAYKMLMAMAELARNQVVLESKLDEHSLRLENIESQLGKITQIEAKLTAPRVVSDDEASQISQAVKAIAMVLSKRSGRNEYGSVYGELYRKFGITSYKLLPAARFTVAMNFLTEWHQSLVDTDTPF